MCNASYWLHVTSVGVVLLAGLVGCRYPPRVSDGLPRNIIPPLLTPVSSAAISSVVPSPLVRMFLFSYFLRDVVPSY
jgi:hypothetical protein